MEPRTGAIFCFVGFFIAFVLFLTCFGAPYWEDNILLHSGIWKSCTRLTGGCVDNVQAMDLVDKGGIARGIQALMCLALIAGIAAGVANIFWIVDPETEKIGIVTCCCIMIAGLFTGIAAGMFSMLYEESVNFLTLLTGTGGGGSSTPSGWAFYVAIACTIFYEVLGMLCCCFACQGGGRSQVGPGGYDRYGRPIHPQVYQNHSYPYHIQQRPPFPKHHRTHGHAFQEGYSYPSPVDPVQPPPYDYRTEPPPYKPN